MLIVAFMRDHHTLYCISICLRIKFRHYCTWRIFITLICFPLAENQVKSFDLKLLFCPFNVPFSHLAIVRWPQRKILFLWQIALSKTRVRVSKRKYFLFTFFCVVSLKTTCCANLPGMPQMNFFHLKCSHMRWWLDHVHFTVKYKRDKQAMMFLFLGCAYWIDEIV